jgi:hypothetical protein
MAYTVGRELRHHEPDDARQLGVDISESFRDETARVGHDIG